MRFKSFSTSTSQASPDCFLEILYSKSAIKPKIIINITKMTNDCVIKLTNIPLLKQNLINVSIRRILACLIFSIQQLSVILIYLKINIVNNITTKLVKLRSGYPFEYIVPNDSTYKNIRYI